MKVLVNTSTLLDPRTGIGRYVEQLCRGLSPLCDLHALLGFNWHRISDQSYVPPIGSSSSASVLRRNAIRQVLRRVPGVRRTWRGIQQIAFQKAVRQIQPTVYHEPNYFAFRFDGPTVITAHDATWVRYPEAHPADRVRFFDRLFPGSLACADRVIVDSAFVAREMQELFSVPVEKIRVIHLGVDDCYRPRGDAATATALRAYGLQHHGYVLSVGTREPRKNIATLLAAFAMLPVGLRQRYPLVITGMHGWGDDHHFERFSRLRAEGSLILTGYVSESNLPLLYSGAALFVYPSIYEGFGLPPLEAMASGVPVIVSDKSALPEVVGDAGYQVPALDVDQLSERMRRVLEAPDLSAELSARGLVRAKAFDWHACVDATLAVYRELTP